MFFSLKLIFLARVHMCHHIADTDEMNSLDLAFLCVPNIRNVDKVVYKIFGCRLGHFLGILFKSIMSDFIFMYGEQASA